MHRLHKFGDWDIVIAPVPLTDISPYNFLDGDPYFQNHEPISFCVYLRHRESGDTIAVRFTVPADMGSDGASCPRLVPIQPVRLMPCGVLHDFGYRYTINEMEVMSAVEVISDPYDISRAFMKYLRLHQKEFFDKLLFIHTMQLTTTTAAGCYAVYAAVAVFGGSSFQNPDTRRRMITKRAMVQGILRNSAVVSGDFCIPAATHPPSSE